MATDRKEYAREYGMKNREKITARTRAWRQANPERAREHERNWRERNPERYKELRRRANYRHNFGLELEEIEAMIEAQGGVCPICEVDISLGGKAGAHVDHEHDTGRIRGITCCNCNVGLGKFKDNPEFLKSAARYLIDGQEIS
jgi:hypothetical protein